MTSIVFGPISVQAATNDYWRIWINIPEYRLYVFHNGQIYQVFNVAVGKPSSPSPVGEYWITNKVTNPTWFPPDRKQKPVPPGPHNPLGKYWMGLNIKGYGIHGNNSAWSIGNPVSQGCFRMDNKDIDLLFRIIPVGTPVSITYTTVSAEVDDESHLWLNIYPDIYRRKMLDEEIQNAINNTGWRYYPHYRALSSLLKNEKMIHLEVPRSVEVVGDLEGSDAFYWNGDVYIFNEAFNFAKPVIATGQLFAGYDNIRILSGVLSEKYRFDWNKELNILRIDRFKVVFNEAEIDDAGRQINAMTWLDLSKITHKEGINFLWDQKSTSAKFLGVNIPGQIIEGHFWVNLLVLKTIWSRMNYEWDEQSWTLRMEVKRQI